MSRTNIKAVHKEFRPYVRSAVANGWSLSTTGRNHMCLTSNTGSKVLFSRTYSEPRGLKNFKRDLQRAGAIAAQ